MFAVSLRRETEKDRNTAGDNHIINFKTKCEKQRK